MGTVERGGEPPRVHVTEDHVTEPRDPGRETESCEGEDHSTHDVSGQRAKVMLTPHCNETVTVA